MSPKNARLKTNGDQSSSASIWTNAIIRIKVSTGVTGSVAQYFIVSILYCIRWAIREVASSRIQSFEGTCRDSNDCWIGEAASRAESPQIYSGLVFRFLSSQLTDQHIWICCPVLCDFNNMLYKAGKLGGSQLKNSEIAI